jgi:ABC-type transport system involved in cytochrome c biogenesis permease subunit
MKSYKSSVIPRYIFMYLIMLLFAVLILLTHLVIEKQNRINFIPRGPMTFHLLTGIKNKRK